MKYSRYIALFAALMCTVCSCSKKKTDTSEAPVPETTQSIENDIPADTEPALEQPFRTLSYEDFAEVDFNVNTINGDPGLVTESYAMPEYTEQPDAEMLWHSEPLFDGSKVYFAAAYGKRINEAVYAEDGSVQGINTHSEVYYSPFCCLDLDTGETEDISDDYFEVLVPAPTMYFDQFLTVHDGYIYYTVLDYQYGDHEAPVTAYGLWLMKLNLETMEKITVGKLDLLTPYMQNGHLLGYSKDDEEQDLYEFSFDTDSWEVLIEDYKDKGYQFQNYGEASDLYFDDELGTVTFVPQDGEKNRTVTTNKYTVKTKLRSGTIVSVTEKKAVIFNESDSTLHIYDIENMERYSIDIKGMSGVDSSYLDSFSETYAYGGSYEQIVPCGEHLLSYNVVTTAHPVYSDDEGNTEQYVNDFGAVVFASYFMPEYGVCYPLGAVINGSGDWVNTGTYGGSTYFFSDTELVLISEGTPQ